MKKLLPLFLLTLMAFFTGCLKTHETFVLNPDGSGKVEFDYTMQQMNFFGEASTPEEGAKEMAAQLVDSSYGVTAWQDLEWKLMDDGRVNLTGTAYFSDFNEFSMSLMGPDSMTEFELEVSQGQLVLTEVAQEEETAPDNPPQDTDALVKQHHMQYKQQRPMMQAMIADLSIKTEFIMPGKVQKAVNFEQEGNRVVMHITGDKMLSALDSTVGDEEWLKANAALISGGPGQGEFLQGKLLNKYLFGKEALLSATVATDKPLFDFAAETEKALSKQEAMFEKLGIADTIPVMLEPGEGVEITALDVISYTVVLKGTDNYGDEPGTTVKLQALFNAPVLSVDDGVLEVFLAGDGRNALPKEKFDRDIHFFNLAEDYMSCTFEVETPKQISGIKVLKGFFNVMVASGVETVDIGLNTLKEGAVSEKLNVKVLSRGVSQWDDEQNSIRLEFPFKRELIKEVYIYNDKGTKLKLESGGSSSYGDKCELEFTTKQTITETGRVELELYKDTQLQRLTFLLEGFEF